MDKQNDNKEYSCYNCLSGLTVSQEGLKCSNCKDNKGFPGNIDENIKSCDRCGIKQVGCGCFNPGKYVED